MLRALLGMLRKRGIDIKSPHRRDATSAAAAQRRLLAGREVRTVLDCGGHHGRLARQYHAMFPAARIYCFEPTPATFRVLEANLAGYERIEAINAAVGDVSGEMDFYMGDDEQSNSLARPGGAGGAVAREGAVGNAVAKVKVVSLGDFCGQRGIGSIDLLKMDIEGYELRALQGLEGMLRAQRVDVIYCEARFEPPAPGCTHFIELASHLRERGYRFFGFYDTLYEPTLRYAWGDVIFASDACLERLERRSAGAAS